MSAYNAEKYIEQSIRSILNQSFDDFEFIIVNDGSTDGTLNQIQQFARNDSRIRLINQENLGLTKTLIKMVSIAKGLYIARMDADDVSHKERLKLQIEYLSKNSGVGMVGSWINRIDTAGVVQSKKKLVTTDEKIKSRLGHENQFVHGSVMFRKDVYMIAEGYDAAFRFSQDYDLWLRIAKITKCANLPYYLYSLRVHEDSISIKNSASQLEYAVKSVMKNVCHQKIQHSKVLYKVPCECMACGGSGAGLNPDSIKIIVSARLLLRRGDYDNAANYYRKMNNIEGFLMSLLLRSSLITSLLKKIYVRLRGLVD